MGLFVLIITFVPFSTANRLVLAVDQQTKTETEDGIVTKTLGSYADYLTVYQDSIVGKVLITTKIDDVQSFLGDQLTTVNIGGQRASLTQEAIEIAPLYQDVMKLTEYNMQDLSQQDIKEIVPLAKKVSTKLLSSNLVKGVYDTFKDYVVDRMLDTERDFIVKLPTFEDADLNTIVRDCFAQIKTIKMENISDDLGNLLDAVYELNDKTTLIVDAMKGNITFEKVRADISVELAQTINGKLSNMTLMEKCFPIAFNPLAKKVVGKLPAVAYHGEDITITWTDSENVSTSVLKTELDNLLNQLVLVVKGVTTDATEFEAENVFNVKLGETDYYFNYSIAENLGEVVDLLKSSQLINTATYNSSIGYLQTFAKSKIESTLDDAEYEHLVLAVNKIVDSLKDETSFKSEFICLGKALKAYQNSTTKDIKAILMAADEILPTYIYSHNIGNGYDANEDSQYVYDQLNLFLQAQVNKYLSGMATFDAADVLKITKKLSTVESLKAEYDKLEDLIEFVKNVEDIKTTANLTTLGHHIDSIKTTSKLLDDETCKILINSFVKDVELPAQFNGVMIGELTLKQKLMANVENIESYEFELAKIGQVLNTDFGAISDLAGYGAIMDTLADSKVFAGTLTEIAKSQVDEHRADFAEYGSLVDGLMENLDRITNTFETEFGYLDDFVDFVQNAGDLTTTANLKELGRMIDDVKDVSLLLDEVTCRDMLKDFIEDKELPDEIKDLMIGELTIKEKLIANVDQIEDYEDELEKTGIVLNIDYTSIVDLADYGAIIDSVYDSKLLDGIINVIVENQFEEREADFAGFETIFNDIKANLNKITNTFEVEFGYIDGFIDFADSADLNDLAQTKAYLSNSLLDEQGKSKSVLLDDKTLYDLITVSIESFKLDGKSLDEFGNLNNNLKVQINEDYENEVAILDVVDGLDALATYFTDNIEGGFEITATTTKQDFTDFGTVINGLKGDQFALILNGDAVNDIGKYVVDSINDAIQSSTNPAFEDKKQTVQDFIDIVDWDSPVNYATLLGKIAEKLGIE